MAREIRCLLHAFYTYIWSSFLFFAVLSIPIWQAVTLLNPQRLMFWIWSYTWRRVYTYNWVLPGGWLTAGAAWHFANRDVLLSFSWPPVISQAHMWQLWLFWMAHWTRVILWLCGVLLAVEWTAPLWWPVYVRVAQLASFDPLPKGGVRERVNGPMQWLFNLVSGNDLRGLSLYDSTWQRGSRWIGLGLGTLVVGLILVPITYAAKTSSTREWIMTGVPLLLGLWAIGIGQAMHNRAETLKRSDEQAELEHLRTLKLTAASKNTRGPDDYTFEEKAQIRQLAHELAMVAANEQRDDKKRQHLRWSQIVRQTQALMQSILLAQVELRNNPAAEDILRQLRDLYETTQSFNPDVEPDQAAMTEMYERIFLARMAKQYGVNLNGV